MTRLPVAQLINAMRTDPALGSQSLRVAAIYESASAGAHAKLFYEELVTQIGDGLGDRLDLWNFQMLGIPAMRDRAANDAACADLVILSMDGNKPLAPAVEEWIVMWICLVGQKRPAVVAFFEASNAESDSTRTYLRGAVEGKQLDFFPCELQAGNCMQPLIVRP